MSERDSHRYEVLSGVKIAFETAGNDREFSRWLDNQIYNTGPGRIKKLREECKLQGHDISVLAADFIDSAVCGHCDLEGDALLRDAGYDIRGLQAKHDGKTRYVLTVRDGGVKS